MTEFRSKGTGPGRRVYPLNKPSKRQLMREAHKLLKSPRTTANYYRERVATPKSGYEYASIRSGDHIIIRQKPAGAPDSEYATQAVLHPKSHSEYEKLCRRGKCPIGKRD